MKLKDQLSISNEIENANKSQSRNTIIGIAISIVLSIISIFFIVSFYYGVINSTNKESNISTVNVSYSDTDDSMIKNSYIDQISNNKLVKESIIYDKYELSFDNIIYSFSNIVYNYPTIVIDDIEYSQSYNKKYNRKEDIVLVYDDLKNNKCILESEYEFMNTHFPDENIICGNLFGSEINEIIISDIFLDMLGITDPSSVINKKISYELPLFNSGFKVYPESDYYGKSIYIFKNYIIKGVFNSKIYNCPSREMNEGYEDVDKYSTPMFWIKQSSLGNIDVQTQVNNYGYEYIYDDNAISIYEREVQNGKFVIPFGFNTYGLTEKEDRCRYGLISFDNVVDSYKFVQTLSSYIKSFEKTYSYRLNYNLSAFFMFYPYFKYISLLLLLGGIILILVSILNINRLMQYSIDKNIKFLAMLRAIGSSVKDINRIFGLRILIQYFKALIISLGISMLICIPYTIIMNYVINSEEFEGIIKYNISFVSYPVIALAVAVVYGLMLYIISVLLSSKVKKGALINVLNGDFN